MLTPPQQLMAEIILTKIKINNYFFDNLLLYDTSNHMKFNYLSIYHLRNKI